MPLEVDANQSTHSVYVTTLGPSASQNGWAAFDADSCNATLRSGCGTVGHLLGDLAGPNDGEVDTANDTLYTANYDNTVSVFDLRHCQAGDLSGCATDTPGTVTPWPDPSFQENALYVAVDQPLHTVYASYQKDAALVAIDTNTCNGTHLTACANLTPPTIHTGADPQGVALDPSTQTLYTANQVDDDISVIAASQCNAETTHGCRHPAPSLAIPFPGALATDAAAHTAYVPNGNGAVSMINTATCNARHPSRCAQAPSQFTAGPYTSGVAIDAATHTVYVSDAGAGSTGSVSVIDDRACNATTQAGCARQRTLQVPAGNPDGIAIDPATDTIYVTTIVADGSNLLSVFNGAICNAENPLGCDQTPAALPVGVSDGSAADMSIAINDATNTLYVTNVEYDLQNASTSTCSTAPHATQPTRRAATRRPRP